MTPCLNQESKHRRPLPSQHLGDWEQARSAPSPAVISTQRPWEQVSLLTRILPIRKELLSRPFSRAACNGDVWPHTEAIETLQARVGVEADTAPCCPFLQGPGLPEIGKGDTRIHM